jgi:hypothetical protein
MYYKGLLMTGLPDISYYKVPKPEKYTNWPQK